MTDTAHHHRPRYATVERGRIDNPGELEILELDVLEAGDPEPILALHQRIVSGHGRGAGEFDIESLGLPLALLLTRIETVLAGFPALAITGMGYRLLTAARTDPDLARGIGELIAAGDYHPALAQVIAQEVLRDNGIDTGGLDIAVLDKTPSHTGVAVGESTVVSAVEHYNQRPHHRIDAVALIGALR